MRFLSSCFNSTLVRFKPIYRLSRHRCIEVSIPLWFDSNLINRQLELYRSLFQFHSGSIQTSSGKKNSVHTLRFNSTLVRFKLPSTELGYANLRKFQFHSGSIQTVNGQDVSHRLLRFQFHSGSIQTCVMTRPTEARPLFQFHSGSIQTEIRAVELHSTIFVSIPLWFDSNVEAVAEKVHNLGCFNSTLVRFKLWLQDHISVRPIPFQFHSGSIQTKNATNRNAES